MAEITKPIRDELRAALKRIHGNPEMLAAVKHLPDSAILQGALKKLGVDDDVLSVIMNYRNTLTDGEVLEILRGFR